MRRSIGIYNLHLRAMGGGEKLTLTLAEHLSLQHDVSVFCAEPVEAALLEKFFAVDLSRVKIVALDRTAALPKLLAKIRGNTATVTARRHYDQLHQLNLDLFINNSYGSELPCPATRGIFMCMFPHAEMNASKALDSYATVVAISQYSAEWISTRWHRTSAIVYPPCDDMGPAETKQKLILNVGRFTADSTADERHHKGQALLLTAFKQMTDLHRDGWKLHLAGSVGTERSFADSLVQAARGVPVCFDFNSSREQLRSLYRRAAIYWHATGYGVDAREYPGKQEHFGISTVEAMSAGAVPLAYATGGQKEIVSDGVDGRWWKEIEELISQTRTLAGNNDLCGRLGQNAIDSSKRFSRQVFAQRMDQVIGDLHPFQC